MRNNLIGYFEKLIEKEFNKNLEKSQPKKKLKKNHAKALEEQTRHVECSLGVYLLLSLNFKKYAKRWNYAHLIKILNRQLESKQCQVDLEVGLANLAIWFSIKALTLVLSLDQEQRNKLLLEHLSTNDIHNCSLWEQKIFLEENLDAHSHGDLIKRFFQSSSLRPDDLKELANCSNLSSLTTYNECQDQTDNAEATESQKFLEFDGLQIKRNMAKRIVHDQVDNPIIFVETTRKSFKKLIISVLNNVCSIVEGPSSSGKTLLIENLAHKTNNKLMRYQMDEMMDWKFLIGNYVCSDIPGEFIWKPGPLYQAIDEDCWILLEDFDNSPLDTVSFLIDLIETRSIKTINSLLDIKSNFRLFLTIRTPNKVKENSKFIDSLRKQSGVVPFDAYGDQELLKIMVENNPSAVSHSSFEHLAQKLLDIYNHFDCSSDRRLDKDGRSLGLRDLLKVCERLNKLSNVPQMSMIRAFVCDIFECFFAYISNQQIKQQCAANVGLNFNMNKEETISLLFDTKPSFGKQTSHLVCGRVKFKLPKAQNEIELVNQSSFENLAAAKFVYTKSSLSLLEKIARCIECNEPVLLCGETGVGKTTVLQHLAKLLSKKIHIINLNHHTEASDLLGSFKPLDIKSHMKIIKEKFVGLFQRTFEVDKNTNFLNHVHNCYRTCNWRYLIKLMLHATSSTCDKETLAQSELIKDWKQLRTLLKKFEDNFQDITARFSFQFFEGHLTKAIENGDWIVLDEINLASSETLQFLSVLLENNWSQNSSIILSEKGESEPIKRHTDFRLFGAMNPASDIGKKNLPVNIRNRFTEIFVDEVTDRNDLNMIVRSYLESLNDVPNDTIKSIVDFYLTLKDEAFLKTLSNGMGAAPTYSLRTLCRALKNASKNYFNHSMFSIYDSICLSFLTDLKRESSLLLEDYIKNSIFKSLKLNLRANSTKPPLELFNNRMSGVEKLDFVNIEGYWILRGTNELPDNESSKSNFIFTKSVKENLKKLARISSARLPCLIQGETSIGKTSLIKWLSEATGNVLIRINNHDHTDLQEYVGNYVVDASNKLTFKEGLLVKAMRHGYWILLDELNLASSEVLEALNRVLDDNRELYIPETQETIHAHPRFLLFATQNPPGKYAGRKQLSKAFRNRFIELNFDEIPEDELLTIIEAKCKLPQSYATLLIKTVVDLKTKRSQVSGIFLGKNSLITLRDLFRWAKRYSQAVDEKVECEDWKQYLAEQGFLILCSRCRSQQDVITIHSSIEKVFNKRINIRDLNDPRTLCRPIMQVLEQMIAFTTQENKESEFVWTPNARRTALLTGLAYKFREPFLLVGDTGLGKTTICQILSKLRGKHLHIVNCHMHSESADFLGSLRPVRQKETTNDDRLFEWTDGPLIVALKSGDDFLIDEISLADDAVLERLNSVLEEERTFLLAENISDNSYAIKAHEEFRIFATMNPGGDFGKKELSIALRNRFTEIWCQSISIQDDDFNLIIEQKLLPTLRPEYEQIKTLCATVLLSFINWVESQPFSNKSSAQHKSSFSIRDLISWLRFINTIAEYNLESNSTTAEQHAAVKMVSTRPEMAPILALIHGACLIFIDSLNIETAAYKQANLNPRAQCLAYLFDKVQCSLDQIGLDVSIEELFNRDLNRILNESDFFHCGPFSIRKGAYLDSNDANFSYCLQSETTASNLQRVLRCLVMNAPVLLEGSPGVGKTSLVEALAKITQNKVIRINLSEQTDLNELFGADLPAVSTKSDQKKCLQRFEWHDGPFLHALKAGYWIILDEINLASQSVLEGLNSCFDHRSEIFIAELNKRFTINKAKTRIFACQNPYIQGGGRKGLPKSFLNRFSKVYIDQMTHSDLLFITKNIYHHAHANPIDIDCLSKMVAFNEKINQEVCKEKQWGLVGSPWEFNLRDILRWCELMTKEQTLTNKNPGAFVYLIYASRFRTQEDRNRVYETFYQIFGFYPYRQEQASSILRFANSHIQVGQSFLSYTNIYSDLTNNLLHEDFVDCLFFNKFCLTDSNLKHMEAIMKCVENNFMTILVGKSCVGKTCLVRMLASLMNQKLVQFAVNNSTDTTDLLGGFEKVKQFKESLFNMQTRIKHIYLSSFYALNQLNKSKIENASANYKSVLNDYFTFMHESKSLLEILAKDEENKEALNASINLYEYHVQNLIQKASSINAELVDGLKSSFEQLKFNFRKQMENKSTNNSMRFEWIDSNLVKAIENGEWVIIDNVNFCAPSVLDRLNPLLEPNGCLQINEKGTTIDGKLYEIKPHKNFRLFLCMNESYGELSRPMRNRGIEMYINEPDQFMNEEDLRITLQTTFPFDGSSAFNQFYEQHIVRNLVHGEKLTFQQLYKIFKTVYEYWLTETHIGSSNRVCLSDCYQTAIQESKLNNEICNKLKNVDLDTDMEIVDQHSSGLRQLCRSFYSDAFKLKEFPLYRFFFNFPLFPMFVEKFREDSQVLLKELAYDINNYSTSLKNSFRFTQLIDVWLRNVPVGSISTVINLTYANLSNEQRLTSKYKTHLKCLFEKHLLELFDPKQHSIYGQIVHIYLSLISTVSKATKFDLSDETIDLNANSFLLQRIQMFHEQSRDESAGDLLRLSRFIRLVVWLYLSNYRVERLYKVQEDSLLHMVKNYGSNLSVLNQHLNSYRTNDQETSFKNVLLLNDFYKKFLHDIALFIKSNYMKIGSQIALFTDQVKKCVVLLERVLLIVSCSFDQYLTIPYLRYHWNLLDKHLNEFDLVSFNWCSENFAAIRNVLNTNLNFDTSVYDKYFKLWFNQQHQKYITSQDELKLVNQLNTHLSDLAYFDTDAGSEKQISKFLSLLNHFDTIQAFLAKCANVVPQQLSYDGIYNLEILFDELKFCQKREEITELTRQDLIGRMLSRGQLLPLYFYSNMLAECAIITDLTNIHANKFLSFNSFSELMTRDFALGKFYSMFRKSSKKCFDLVDVIEKLIILNNQETNLQNDPNAKLSRSIFEKETLSDGSLLEQKSLNQISLAHYNWLDEYISKMFMYNAKHLNQDRNAINRTYNFSLKLTLCFYDQSLSQLVELNSFLWKNYTFLNGSDVDQHAMSERMAHYVREQLKTIRSSSFESDNEFFDYLNKKGFNVQMLTLARKHDLSNMPNAVRDSLELISLGCLVSFLFAPVSLMDPVEQQNLAEMFKTDAETLNNFEVYLDEANKLKLKNIPLFDHQSKSVYSKSLPLRDKKGDFFRIANELQDSFRQFCSIEQLDKLIDQLMSRISNGKNDSNARFDQEYLTWIVSLEKFINRIMIDYPSYYDITYASINGLSLIGYGFNSLYTFYKCKSAKNSGFFELIKLLFVFPYENSHLNMASEILDHCRNMFQIDFTSNECIEHANNGVVDYELVDELHYLALLHLFNSLNQNTTNSSQIFYLFVQVCTYFNKRYQTYLHLRRERERVDEFKYKAYGQAKSEEELDLEEFEKYIPSFSSDFHDIINQNQLSSLESINKTEPVVEVEESVENKYLLSNVIFDRVFPLIQRIFEYNKTKKLSKEHADKFFLKTFFNSYSLASSLLNKSRANMSLLNQDNKSSRFALLSHMLFSASIGKSLDNYDFDSVYNIYHDSNLEQVLVCKQLLNGLTRRLDELLTTWKENPVLLEIKKIVQRIELFSLNDSLMRYLNGLELLLEKAENWQLIAPQMYSLDAELKQINERIVEWRKMEMKFWQNSLDLECAQVENKCAYNWFFTTFAVCQEFVDCADSQADIKQQSSTLLLNLNNLIETSSYGEYAIRLKTLRLCLFLFSSINHNSLDEKQRRNKLLNDLLWSVNNYYEKTFTVEIQNEIHKNKLLIQKELKEFTDIFKWQDANYWALKQSTIKSNKTYFKTIKKFRAFLGENIKFSSLNSLSKMVNGEKWLDQSLSSYLSKNYVIKFDKEQFSIASNDAYRNYSSKMKTFCQKLLKKKFSKNSYNKSIEQFSVDILHQYSELDKQVQVVMDTQLRKSTDKEVTEKLKKDLKNLSLQRSKFTSELFKQLSFIGLSHRKGNIYYSNMNTQHVNTILFNEPKLDRQRFFNDDSHMKLIFELGEQAYYSCANNYMNFKQLYSINENKNAASLPINQFVGYVDHLFHIVHEQRSTLNEALTQLCLYQLNHESIEIISQAKLFEPKNETHLKEFDEFISRSIHTIEQIELFFTNVISAKLNSKQDATTPIINELGVSYEAVKTQLIEFKQRLLQNSSTTDLHLANGEERNLKHKIRLVFPDEQIQKSVSDLKSMFTSNSALHLALLTLHQEMNTNCAPFEKNIEQIQQNFNILLSEVSQARTEIESDEGLEKFADLLKETQTTIDSILKSTENIFKKYDCGKIQELNVYDSKASFIQESSQAFSDDLNLINLGKINELAKSNISIVDKLCSKKQPNDKVLLGVLREHFGLVANFSKIYNEFLRRWLTYLGDNHLKSCHLLCALMFVLSELKTKDLVLPKVTENSDEDANENKSKKFETDNQDPSGLGEGMGTKDVSDQIENEDQLDDAKTKEEREREKQEEKPKEQIEEQEKGIEMSDDFDGELNDVAMDDHPEEQERDEKEEEEQEDLDDQKGDVDKANNALDNELWNEPDNEDEKNLSEEENLDNKHQGNEVQDKKQSEMAAKEDELPMNDKKESKSDELEDEVHEAKQDEEDEKCNEKESKNDEKNEKESSKEDKHANEDLSEQDKQNEQDEKMSVDLDQMNENMDDLGEEEKEEGDLNENMEGSETSDEEKDNEHEKENRDKQSEEALNEEKEEEKMNEDELDENRNSNSTTNKNELKSESNISYNNKEKMNDACCDQMGNEQKEEEPNESSENKNQDSCHTASMNQANESKSKTITSQVQSAPAQRDNRRNDKKLGSKDEKRVLAEQAEREERIGKSTLKDDDQNKTVENEEQINAKEEQPNEEQSDFTFTKDENEKFDSQVFDAATESQKRKMNELDRVQEQDDAQNDQLLDNDDELEKEKEPDEIYEKKEDIKFKRSQNTQDVEMLPESERNIELKNELLNKDECVQTQGPSARPNESMFMSNLEVLRETREQVESDLTDFRQHLKHSDYNTNEPIDQKLFSKSLDLWMEYEYLTNQLSKELCEQLRLILEPTIKSKLKGDYKTGKRLNMKRVVEYIATEYRKDKIWLRRTKPDKRDYHVLLAIDNSSSMNDNHCIQLAYETIATLVNSFNYLDVGQIGLLSFGQKINDIQNMGEKFHSEIGAKILCEVDFRDEKTRIAQMLNHAVELFDKSRSNKNSEIVSNLLIILSDGRGIFHEGIDVVKQAVKNAHQKGLFVLFVVLDISKNSSSIFDIKMPIFTEGSPIPIIKSYMENFPFPFYIVLKEINSLPMIMSEALKQWFELVTKIEI